MAASSHLVPVAAHGLAGSRTDLPAEPLSVVEWFDVVQACRAHHIVGFLAAAVAAGRFPVTSGQAEELAALEREGAGLSLLVERQAAALARALAAAGVDHRVVDGPARRIAYGDVGHRHVHEVHVLVADGDLDTAVRVSGRQAGPGVRGHRHRVSIRSSIPGTGGHDVETPGDGAAPTLLDRLGPGVELSLAGPALTVLSPEQQLVATCVATMHVPVVPLVGLRDIAQLALLPELDCVEARRVAVETGAVGALAEGVTTAWATFDLADKTELSAWAFRLNGRRPATPAGAGPAAARAPARPGFARRVLGRRHQPTRPDTVPAPAPADRVATTRSDR